MTKENRKRLASGSGSSEREFPE